MKTLILTTALLAATSQVYAWTEPYLYGGAGLAFSDLNDKPGLWRQEGLPYVTDLQTMTIKAGIGIEHSSGFFVQLGYVDLGEPSINSLFVKDDEYSPSERQCKKNCNELHNLDIVDDMRGGELLVGFRYNTNVITPYVDIGIAGFNHRISGSYKQYKHNRVTIDPDDRPMGQNLEGMIISAAMGGGICLSVAYGIEACGDVTYYRFIAHEANPLVEGVIATTGLLRVPVGF